MTPIRVVVVDDHAGVRAALARVLDTSPEFTAVSALADENDLFRLLRREQVDVVIVDHDLEQTDGLSLCLRIKQERDPPPVVIYSGYATPVLRLAAVVAQADAVVHKAEPVHVLLGTLRRLTRGDRLLEPPPRDLLDAAKARLGAADLPVVALLVDGTHPLDIAQELALGEGEVVDRAHRIVDVLQARGRWGRDPIAGGSGVDEGDDKALRHRS
jgi:DNA-binding NarL/FixJ family response regulator